MQRWTLVFFLISFLEVRLLVARRCPEPTKHYTTIGCIPSEQQTAAGCPRWNPARGVAEFHCAHIDCPEFLTPPNRTGCVRQYRVRECCATRQVCGEKKAHLTRCSYGDTRYYEGERMNFADDPCRTCICTEHFNATDPLSDTKCFTNDCPFELISPSVLMSGAAPVYYNNGCCPWEWRMPKPEDRLDDAGDGVPPSLPYRCRYGNLTLQAGQSLVPDVTATGTYECKCAIPPMVHCILKAT
ncbi:uncharacterized protein LOC118464934 isoform X2 [Anopheles albimanus]|uniref:uncharacterized protein LOC118464934 isoform X2 n=1 Tax=Anopheles albimanus TaxID=7167 RepID=UPI00163F5B54|nr:uncharacterized protein LOC118464934 isoform X2 [Anopheles albimanus]